MRTNVGSMRASKERKGERTSLLLSFSCSSLYLFHVQAQVPERGGQGRQQPGTVGPGDADHGRRRVGAIVDGNHGRGGRGGGISRLGDRSELCRRRARARKGERRGPRRAQGSARRERGSRCVEAGERAARSRRRRRRGSAGRRAQHQHGKERKRRRESVEEFLESGTRAQNLLDVEKRRRRRTTSSSVEKKGKRREKKRAKITRSFSFLALSSARELALIRNLAHPWSENRELSLSFLKRRDSKTKTHSIVD